jgi:hypothetical protein
MIVTTTTATDHSSTLKSAQAEFTGDFNFVAVGD